MLPDSRTEAVQEAQRAWTPRPTSEAHTGNGGKRVTATPGEPSVCAEEPKTASREEVGPAGNLTVMEEGFARVIVQ